MTASACCRQRGLLLRSFKRILITVVGLHSMGFDTLRTVKADTNETVLEGALIRYGESAAQIAFATGELPTCSRGGRRHILKDQEPPCNPTAGDGAILQSK